MIQSQNDVYFPPEWQQHKAVWLAYPADASLWQENLLSAQNEFVEFCRAISHHSETGHYLGEKLNVLVTDLQVLKKAEMDLAGLPVQFFIGSYGDIWLRDTGPIFLQKSKQIVAQSFSFNGWGSKYLLEGDAEVSQKIGQWSGCLQQSDSMILEGGAIEVDGQGTLLTTEQCLLNPNRNKGWSQAKIETHLCHVLGVQKILWIQKGLLNDHTDGHIDTIVRFVRPGEVVCMYPAGLEDPNYKVLDSIYAELINMQDACGRPLKVHRVTSPGLVLNEDQQVMPASYVNFYIANTTVVVPLYGVPQDEIVCDELKKIFPDRRVVGCSAKAILSGGGAFHCISQQQPEFKSEVMYES